MILVIDASNIRAGGGITHLIGLLSGAHPKQYGFEKIIVWTGKATRARLPSLEWVEYRHHPFLDKNVVFRILWQLIHFSHSKHEEGDILFVPGGSYYGRFKNYVSMLQNLLPFEWREIKRYGISKAAMKLLLLRIVQSFSLKRALGNVFLTKINKEQFVTQYKLRDCISIAHGVDNEFKLFPRQQHHHHKYNETNPYRILYVSTIDVYKNQLQVIEAVAQLKHEGMPIRLELVGPYYKPAYDKVMQSIQHHDPMNTFIHYLKDKSKADLISLYHNADTFVFASSCETFGIILLEAMVSGLPIICADRPTLRETLGDAGLYFNHESPRHLASRIKQLFLNTSLRERCALKAYEKAKEYSWEHCANETYAYLAKIASKID